MPNVLTLAVAGSRKTQGIVELCASLPIESNIAVVTFTQANQIELEHRLSVYAGNHSGITVRGWYAFLLKDFARPFIPYMFPGERIQGFNFDARPFRYAKGIRRFLDSNNHVYACELGRLAFELIELSNGKLLHRLECVYDKIFIDEVQDMSSYDWDILDLLLDSSIELRMVGDIRQSVLSTNPRSSKNKEYQYAAVIDWFRERERKGKLQIEESNITWRCHPEIARFSDDIFCPDWRFSQTDSKNTQNTGHDGVYLVAPESVESYVSEFHPQCLRSTASSGKNYEFEFLNFKVSKGQTFERVLIVPTQGIIQFLKTGKYLQPLPAASFYVAVTRAKQSVAIVVPNPEKNIMSLPIWQG